MYRSPPGIRTLTVRYLKPFPLPVGTVGHLCSHGESNPDPQVENLISSPLNDGNITPAYNRTLGLPHRPFRQDENRTRSPDFKVGMLTVYTTTEPICLLAVQLLLVVRQVGFEPTSSQLRGLLLIH